MNVGSVLQILSLPFLVAFVVVAGWVGVLLIAFLFVGGLGVALENRSK